MEQLNDALSTPRISGRRANQTLPLSSRTLIIQPLPGIGDMVWHLPAIHTIATTTITGRVDILTKPRSLADQLLRADPSVDRILWLERDSGPHRGIAGLFRLVSLLSDNAYQRVWLLHHSARYGLAAWLAGIPERIGCGGRWRPWWLTLPVQLPSQYHHAHPIPRANAFLEALNLCLVEAEPRLTVAMDVQQKVRERFSSWPQPWIALGIGSSEIWKQWGAARFIELALALYQRQPGSLFMVGGPAERVLADQILAAVSDNGGAIADAVGLPLQQAAGLLASCRCYIGNDTGILNMAAALEIPAVGLFGGSPPLTHSTYIHAVLPTMAGAGMAAITVTQVLEKLAWLNLLNEAC
jgi:heptosyltransferase-2